MPIQYSLAYLGIINAIIEKKKYIYVCMQQWLKYPNVYSDSNMLTKL